MDNVIRDESGRIVAPAQADDYVRPPGPWDNNQHTVCPWCPSFNRKDPRNAGASHKMCASCFKELNK